MNNPFRLDDLLRDDPPPSGGKLRLDDLLGPEEGTVTLGEPEALGVMLSPDQARRVAETEARNRSRRAIARGQARSASWLGTHFHNAADAAVSFLPGLDDPRVMARTQRGEIESRPAGENFTRLDAAGELARMTGRPFAPSADRALTPQEQAQVDRLKAIENDPNVRWTQERNDAFTEAGGRPLDLLFPVPIQAVMRDVVVPSFTAHASDLPADYQGPTVASGLGASSAGGAVAGFYGLSQALPNVGAVEAGMSLPRIAAQLAKSAGFEGAVGGALAAAGGADAEQVGQEVLLQGLFGAGGQALRGSEAIPGAFRRLPDDVAAARASVSSDLAAAQTWAADLLERADVGGDVPFRGFAGPVGEYQWRRDNGIGIPAKLAREVAEQDARVAADEASVGVFRDRRETPRVEPEPRVVPEPTPDAAPRVEPEVAPRSSFLDETISGRETPVVEPITGTPDLADGASVTAKMVRGKPTFEGGDPLYRRTPTDGLLNKHRALRTRFLENAGRTVLRNDKSNAGYRGRLAGMEANDMKALTRIETELRARGYRPDDLFSGGPLLTDEGAQLGRSVADESDIPEDASTSFLDFLSDESGALGMRGKKPKRGAPEVQSRKRLTEANARMASTEELQRLYREADAGRLTEGISPQEKGDFVAQMNHAGIELSMRGADPRQQTYTSPDPQVQGARRAIIDQLARISPDERPLLESLSMEDLARLAEDEGIVGGAPALKPVRATSLLRDESGRIGVSHGSPHKFPPEPGHPMGKFRMEKLGTGEGAQAYGHGLYFAGDEAVAKHYRERLSRPSRSQSATSEELEQYFTPGKRVKGYGGYTDEVVRFNRDPATGGWSVDVREVTKNPSTGLDELGQVRTHRTEPTGDQLIQSGIRQASDGALYRADIDAEPEHFLDWDKPLSEQSAYVIDRLRTAGVLQHDPVAYADEVRRLNDAKQRTRKAFEASETPETRAAVRDASLAFENYVMEQGRLPMDGAALYKSLGTPEEASVRLREAGITGNRYLDSGSRGVGQGSHNYVVFSDKPITITGREGAGAPRLLAGTSGALGGAAYGYTQGETPEERFRNAIAFGTAGLVGGVGIGHIAENADQIWSRLRSSFRSRGDLPADVFDRKLARNARLSAAGRQVAYTLRDFDRAARRAAREGFNLADESVRAVVDDVLAGRRSPDTLPEALRAPVQAMRTHVDALSRRMVEEGVVQGDLAAKVEGNLGTYLTRSYRAFDDPKWAKNVPEDVKNRAIGFIRGELEARGLTGAELDEQVALTVQRLLVRDEASPVNFLAKGKLGNKDLSSFIKRKDIAPEIRALMGEYRDPRVNYVRSVARTSQVLENDQLLREVREQGMGRFLHDEPRQIDGVFYDHRIAAEGNPRMAPLDGLYTTKEFADAFRETMGEGGTPPMWLAIYSALNGVVKYGKTVGSVASTVRNFFGNGGFTLMNGHYRVNRARQAAAAVRANLGAGDAVADRIAQVVGGKDTKAWRDYYQRLSRAGVVNESLVAGELRAVLKDAKMDTTDWQERLLSRGAQVADLPAQVYQAADDIWKVYAFENEVARYRQAHPEMPPAELDALAAKIVRDTYPTYSLVPPAIQALRRFPVVGSFVSFYSEVFRTSFNTLALAKTELTSPNPAIRKIGAQRAAGIAAMLATVPAITVALRSQLGITAEEDNDVRRFLPEWSRNSPIAYTGKPQDGRYTYADIAFTDPHSVLRKPLYALLQGKDLDEAALEALRELTQPFLGEEILAGKIADVARNTTQTGRPVYNPEAPFGDRMRDSYLHLWDAFEPGTMTSARRVIRGVSGEVGAGGRAYDPGQEVLAVATGTRQQTLDIPQALTYKVRDFLRRERGAQDILRDVAGNRGNISTEQLAGAYQESNAAREEAFQDLLDDLSAAGRLGVPDDRIRSVMRAAGMSQTLIKQALDGVYTPYRPSEEYLSAAERLLSDQTGNADSVGSAFTARRTSLDSLATEAGAPPRVVRRGRTNPYRLDDLLGSP